MSSNKGKDGEMRLGIILAGAAIKENGLDFTRPTITNQSDLGADYVIRAPAAVLRKIAQLGRGDECPHNESDYPDSIGIVEARIDVKTTDSKLTGDVVDKFAADVRKHPNITAHLLIGGTGLTKSAQERFRNHKSALSEDGKVLEYISSQGVARLVSEYKDAIEDVLNPPPSFDEFDRTDKSDFPAQPT